MPTDAVFVRLCVRPIPRVLRMMHVAEGLGYTPRFVGAFREEGLAPRDRWDGWEVERIGPYFPLVNGSRFALYVLSVLRYGLALFLRLWSLRPGLIHVSDVEVFWPARIYAWLTRTPLVYNVHDNLSQRYPVPDWIAGALNAFEGLAAACASATTVPEAFRRDALPAWCRSNVLVVKNAPFDPGFRPPPPPSDGPTNVLFGGWIDAGRGIRPLGRMVERCADCRLVLAGEGDAELVAEARANERVDYRGYVRNEELIAMTDACDFVAALYDPIRPINRFAASNKIAEALAVGRPLVINAEQEIAGLLAEHDCAVIVPYAEAESIGPMLHELRRDRERYEGLCRRAREVYEAHYAWNIVHEASLRLYAAAGVKDLGAGKPRERELKPEMAAK